MEGPRQPVAFDMFCGPNAPISLALRWCGWRVTSVDLLYGTHCDLGVPENQQRYSKELEAADATFWAPACETLTRARERPIPGHPNPPRPLRSAAYVRGLSGLAVKDQERVQKANKFIDFMWHEVRQGAETGQAEVVENPTRSWLWNFDGAKNMQTKDWMMVEYCACVWMGAREKRETLGTNVVEMKQIAGECKHVHDGKEWLSYGIDVTFPERLASHARAVVGCTKLSGGARTSSLSALPPRR